MTTRPRPHHDRKPEPADIPRRVSGSMPPGDDTTAASLTGLSRDLLYDEMRRGNLAYVKVGRRRLITRQHLNQFLGIAS